jgi:hypothetical protein
VMERRQARQSEAVRGGARSKMSSRPPNATRFDPMRRGGNCEANQELREAVRVTTRSLWSARRAARGRRAAGGAAVQVKLKEVGEKLARPHAKLRCSTQQRK